MDSILNKKVELLPVPLREGYIHCDICQGISWLLNNSQLVKCRCNSGLVKVCKQCNQPFASHSYYCKNDECIAYFDLEKSLKEMRSGTELALDDELVKQSDMFYSSQVDGYKEGYYSSIEDYLDYLYDNEIELTNKNNILWLCEAEEFSIDIDSVIENELEDHYEDAYDNISDIEELREFVDSWCKKQNITTYYQDKDYYIRVINREKI